MFKYRSSLTQKDLIKGLLQYNYLPRQHDDKEELPPIFNSIKLTPKIAQKLRATACRKNGYDVLPYRRTRHPNIPRMMGIPHPRAYIELVFTIAENWEKHITFQCQSPNSEIGFEKHDDGRIIIQKYDRVDPDGDPADPTPLTNFGKEYKVKTDITNFFHSIYSHSLPWALVGHKTAKGKRESSEWFNRIDWATRLCQRNETKGVPIGPATSNLLSEIILFKVDEVMRMKGFEFSRYIDDYKAYTKTQGDAEKFLTALSSELEKYALNLNPRKTVISKLPVPERDDWTDEINLFLGQENKIIESEKTDTPKNNLSLRQVKTIINRALSLSQKHPDGSILKYALAAIINRGMDSETTESYFEDAILRYAYHFPTIIPLIQRMSELGVKHDWDHLHERLLQLLRKSLSDGQSDNSVWCLYFLRKANAELKESDWKKVWASNDPMVMLMGYVFAKKNRLPIKKIISWANKQIKGLKNGDLDEYDLDRFWLLLYQLFFDGEITAPYREEQENKVFECLKKNSVSFINENHANFKSLAENMFENLDVKPPQ